MSGDASSVNASVFSFENYQTRYNKTNKGLLMDKLFFLIALFAIPFQAFCYQTLTCNGFSVENQIVSLEQWGNKIYDVRCENPYADRNNQRWTIVYDQK